MANLEELKRVAVFDVGDYAYTKSGGKPWKIRARYWSDQQQSIVYDLVYEYNGVTLARVPEPN